MTPERSRTFSLLLDFPLAFLTKPVHAIERRGFIALGQRRVIEDRVNEIRNFAL
jgi:hypothetical protein